MAATAKNQFAPIIKRLRKVRVGDLLQYRYQWCPQARFSVTTRPVIEVIDNGAEFVVKDGFHVKAGQVLTHIEMHQDSEGGADRYEFCGVRDER